MSPNSFGFDDFLSVFTWRYGSPEMREVFSEIHYRELWRSIWAALAEAQAEFGIIDEDEARDIKSKMGRQHIDLVRAHEIEREIRHDVMAEVKAFAEQCPVGGGKIHLGATSMDITDNADIIRMREASQILLERMLGCLEVLCEKVLEYKDTVCMGWTHIQPAEPITLGYRFANYAQDMVIDLSSLEFLMSDVLMGKGIKGAVGTSGSFVRLLGDIEDASRLEEAVMRRLKLDYYTVSTQTYPRKVDYLVLSALSGIAQSAHKFALDVRVLQSPNFGEVSEPIGAQQVGSSAMPFKKNPVKSERICSLSRYVSSLPNVCWCNASQTILERTLDDSANRRIVIPEGFLAVDECLILYYEILDGLVVYPEMMRRNLKRYGPFSGTEALLMKLSRRGMDRQKAHERLRRHSFRSWSEVMKGKENPLPQMLKDDPEIMRLVKPEEVDETLNVYTHVGDAPKRCEKFVEKVCKPILEKYEGRTKKVGKATF